MIIKNVKMLENVRHMKFKEQGTILKTQKEKTITTKKKKQKKTSVY